MNDLGISDPESLHNVIYRSHASSNCITWPFSAVYLSSSQSHISARSLSLVAEPLAFSVDHLNAVKHGR
jgi:hypothetical protein